MADVVPANSSDHGGSLSTTSSTLPTSPSFTPQLTRPLSQPVMATSRSHGAAEEVTAAAAESTPLNGPYGPLHNPPTPARPSRKRAASISIDEANPPRIQDLSLYTPSSTTLFGGDSPRALICLCTKAPKVPRPRNAFILYRQHYQAQVAAQHPGLANPDISKLIGEQWREQAEEVKNSWKRLAEEEKVRHQLQYPDYRYQPRRGGKGGQGKPNSAGGEGPGLCPKCGGRYIATPRTPPTPFSAATPAAAKPLTMSSYINPHPRIIETDHLRHGSNASMMSIESHIRRYTQPHLRNIDEEYAMMSPTGPPDKRRRFNPPSNGFIPASPLMGFAPHLADHRFQPHPSMSGAPMSATGYGPGPLPRPPMQQQQMCRQPNGAPRTQPPQQPSFSYQGGPVQMLTHGGAGFDESLRLPPLQTQLPNSPTLNSDVNTATATIVHNAGPGIMTGGGQPGQRAPMSPRWQFLLKLDMLRAISPPLKPPGPGAAPFDMRGPIIVIEGLSPIILKEVTAVVAQALSVSGGCTVKLWADNEMNGENPCGKVLEKNEDNGLPVSPLAKFMAEMLKWHHTSGELIKYVTHSPSLTSKPNSNTIESDIAQTQLQPPTDSHMVSASTAPQLTKIPVAVVSTGYSLTISDRYAAMLPITDAYRSEDHWRWVATLWRGIVGPDLTVYVKQRCSEDEIRGNNCVEFVNASVVVLRIAEGAKGLDEKLERRLGFEIMEWVRNGNFGKKD